MKVSVLQENLTKGLNIVSRAVASRSSLPILHNVKLATDDGRLKLSATNLEIGINCWLGAKVEQEGAITVPARLLTDYVNSLPDERIDLRLKDESKTLNLKCARFKSNIKGIDAFEFPIVGSVEPDKDCFDIESSLLKEMITQVSIAAATDESRPVLTGVMMQFGEHNLTMAAADGYRLSVKECDVKTGLDTECIVPGKAIIELGRLLKDADEPVKISMASKQKQIMFSTENFELVSQLIEGVFPDFTQIIPTSHTTRVIVDTKSFQKAVKVAGLFAKDSANIVKMTISGEDETQHQAVFSANSPEMGDNTSEVDVALTGSATEIAFNAKYTLDFLTIVGAPQVVIELSEEADPGKFYPVGDDDFIHVIMPMHINR